MKRNVFFIQFLLSVYFALFCYNVVLICAIFCKKAIDFSLDREYINFINKDGIKLRNC